MYPYRALLIVDALDSNSVESKGTAMDVVGTKTKDSSRLARGRDEPNLNHQSFERGALVGEGFYHIIRSSPPQECHP